MTAASPWWAGHVHADRRPRLLARGRILQRLRANFEGQDFTEVDTAILQISPGNETHLHAFASEIVSPAGERSRLYLHTSPEFACKKLLAAGERKIFQFAKTFRNRERSTLHHPEFTMLEWYRAGEPYQATMTDCMEIVATAAEITDIKEFTYKDRAASPHIAAEIVSVAEAFERHAGIDLLATITADEADRDGLAAQATAAGIRLADDDTWSDIFSRVLVEKVEPELGNGRPTLLIEYPAVEAALARKKPSDPRVSERFEMFVCGVELANGFGELTDPHELQRRFAAEMAEKAKRYGETYPIDPDFIAAIAEMPQASGCALGFDRLAMLATGASRIDQVMWTPVADAGTPLAETRGGAPS